jgi:hypothetical protein
MNMDINWSGESGEKGNFLQPNLIGQPGNMSQMNNNSDGHSSRPAPTTINGVVLHIDQHNDLSNTPNGNMLRPQEIKIDGNRYFANNIKNPHAIRREVSFRQQCNSGDKRHQPNMVVSSSQSGGKQTPPSISNVTSVERARARALQAVNYYNSSVLGDPTMEPPAQFAGKQGFLCIGTLAVIYLYCNIILCSFVNIRLNKFNFHSYKLGGHPTSSVQIMNQTNKNTTFGLNAMGGGNVETYKSLGDVFGIQAAVDSMKTAAYANQEMITAASSSNVNGNHSIHDMSQTRHINNMTDSEKRSNGGKLYLANFSKG